LGALGVTPTDKATTAASIGDHTASVWSSVTGVIGMAQAALDGDPVGATNQASPMLHRLETVLDELSDSTADDQDLRAPLSAIRDEIGAYLLAAEALEASGVAPTVTVALLRRGTDQAQKRVNRLATRASTLARKPQ
jgi:hypothetical protein